MRLLERILFGAEATKRADEAEQRLAAAIGAQQSVDQDVDAARRRLRSTVDDVCDEAAKTKSEPPRITLRPVTGLDWSEFLERP